MSDSTDTARMPCPCRGSNEMCGCQNGPHPVSRDPLGLVKVRPLVWDGFRAGPYWIEVEADGIAHLFCDYDRTDEGVEQIMGGFLTLVSLDDLKAAAQQDYEARIRSALEPDPQDARVAALKYALEGFNPRRIGFGQSLSHDALGEAWSAARTALAAFDKGGKDE